MGADGRDKRASGLRALSFLVVAAALLFSIVTAASAQQWVPNRSGMPWPSGAVGCCGGMSALQAFRGRKLDFRTTYLFRDSWAAMIAHAGSVGGLVADGAAAVVALGLMPETHRAQHRQCRLGQFDPQIRSVGAALVRAGTPRAILRLGWEANRLNGYPWNVTGDGSEYKACFRRWVSVLRTVPGQRFVIDWNMQDKSIFPLDQMYPGDDVVQIIGINPYDRCPPLRTEAQWNAWYNSKHKDGRNPRGIGTWLAFARQHGKKFSVPEWGIGGPLVPISKCGGESGIDNPFFIRKMFGFFQANAADIAYEGYFNGHGAETASRGSHKLAPTIYNPLSSAAYRELWGLP